MKRITKRFIILIPFLLAGYLYGQVQTLEGKLFRKEGNRELLYIQKEFISLSNRGNEITHIYYKADNTEAAYERVTLNEGLFESYELEIKDLDTYGRIQKKEGFLEITFQNRGKEKTRTIVPEGELITGPMLPDFIETNQSRLLMGETLNFLLPYFEKQTLVPFRMVPVEETLNTDQIRIQMKLKNFLLGMLIDPVDFILDRESGKVTEIHGPTILPDPYSRKKTTMVDTEIYYTYY